MDHYDESNKDQHFFATTAFGWGVGADPVTAINNAKSHAGSKERNKPMFCGLFHVPLPLEAHYQIAHFTPQVEGTTKLYEGVA